MQVKTAKVQERGNITIPRMVREKLGAQRGSTIAFIVRDDGTIQLKATDGQNFENLVAIKEELDEFFQETGIPFDKWQAAGRDARAKLFKKMYPGLAKKQVGKQ